MRISYWSDVCSSDLRPRYQLRPQAVISRRAGIGPDAPGAAERPLHRKDGDAAVGAFIGEAPPVVTRHPGVRRRGLLPLRARFHAAHLGEIGHAPIVHRPRSEEHTSELQALMRISYAVFCLNTKN